MQMFVSRSKFILAIPIILVSILQCSSAGTMSQRQLAADGKYENKIYSASRWSLKTIFAEVGAHDLSPLCRGSTNEINSKSERCKRLKRIACA